NNSPMTPLTNDTHTHTHTHTHRHAHTHTRTHTHQYPLHMHTQTHMNPLCKIIHSLYCITYVDCPQQTVHFIKWILFFFLQHEGHHVSRIFSQCCLLRVTGVTCAALCVCVCVSVCGGRGEKEDDSVCGYRKMEGISLCL